MNCTICGHNDSREIVEFVSGVKILVCAKCSNAFTYPPPKLPDYVAEDFHANGEATNKLTRLEDLPEEIRTSYDIQSKLVERHVSKGEPILEIGGGEGIFLNILLERGHLVEMNEPSLSAAARARSRGLKVYNDYFQAVRFDSAYSLIAMAHVLEHIEDPMKFIWNLRTILKPSGYLLLTQTNYRGFMPRFLKDKWYAWVPEQHFSHFTINGIRFMADNSDFEIVDYKYSRLYHDRSVYHRALRYIPFFQDQVHVLLKLKSR